MMPIYVNTLRVKCKECILVYTTHIFISLEKHPILVRFLNLDYIVMFLSAKKREKSKL